MIFFITLEEVIEYHHQMITQFGGSYGIRDLGLLISAVEIPQATFGGVYLHESVFDQAAAYLFHIIGNHPFMDGNKRTAVVTALTFLSVNEVQLIHNSQELEDYIIEIAQGCHLKHDISEFLKKLSISDACSTKNTQ